MITNYGEKPIHDFKLVVRHVSGMFEVMGVQVQMNGDFQEKHFTGELTSDSGKYTIEAKKSKTKKK